MKSRRHRAIDIAANQLPKSGFNYSGKRKRFKKWVAKEFKRKSKIYYKAMLDS